MADLHNHLAFAGNLFVVSAPSGAGKSSLVSALLAADSGIRLSVSYTTRPPRPGEKNGREYNFIGVEEFTTLRAQGEFLESAQVHGNFYGTSRTWIARALAEGVDVLLEIDWQGAAQIRKQFPDVTAVFILPPSIAALETRLIGRGTDAPEVIARRIAAAAGEIAHAPDFDYVIINQDFPVALQQLSTLVAATRLRFHSQAARHAGLFATLGLKSPSES